MKEDMNKKIDNIENKTEQNFINLKNNFQNVLNYLNKQGANLKLIKENENISHNQTEDKNRDKIIRNILSYKTKEENLKNVNQIFQTNIRFYFLTFNKKFSTVLIFQ